MVRIFQFLAVVLTGVAALLFWRRDSDTTFVAAVLAACSFLLSIRYQMKARIAERSNLKARENDTEDSSPQ